MARRRLLPAVLVAAGVLVAVAVPAGWLVTRPPRTVGADAAEALARPAPAPAPASPAAGRSRVAVPARPQVPVRDGRPRAGSRPAPVEVRLPELEVAARVVAVGVTGDGQLEIPADVRTVGWYRYGPRPGDPSGSVVLSGHVDSAEQGRGAFFALGRLRPGDAALVRTGDGRTWRYRVVAREQWGKRAVPLDRVFGRSGAPRLTLLTCGGGFREDVRSYRDTVAVTAVPEGVA
jgi:hypothetical protein